jgi:UDP-N-acetyl-D-glucosamine dehydrogenase
MHQRANPRIKRVDVPHHSPLKSTPHSGTKRREHSCDLRSPALAPAMAASYDLAVIATNHVKFDYLMILANARLIVDTRGVHLRPADNVVKA